MSLTSYRAAPPRDSWSASRARNGREEGERELGGLAGLAATYSSTAGAAVPWALRVFTAEFGMGSGVWPLAMATRPGKPPCDVIGWGRKCLGAAWGLALHAGGGAALVAFGAAGLRLSPRCNELHRPAPMDQADPSD